MIRFNRRIDFDELWFGKSLNPKNDIGYYLFKEKSLNNLITTLMIETKLRG